MSMGVLCCGMLCYGCAVGEGWLTARAPCSHPVLSSAHQPCWDAPPFVPTCLPALLGTAPFGTHASTTHTHHANHRFSRPSCQTAGRGVHPAGAAVQ